MHTLRALLTRISVGLGLVAVGSGQAWAMTATLRTSEINLPDRRLVFIAEGRIGDVAHATPTPTFEVGLAESLWSMSRPERYSDHQWESGKPTDFILRFDGQTGIIMFQIGRTYLFNHPLDVSEPTDIVVTARAASRSTVRIEGLALQYEPIDNVIVAGQATSPFAQLHIEQGDIRKGFTLTGTVTLDFGMDATQAPTHSALGFEIKVLTMTTGLTPSRRASAMSGMDDPFDPLTDSLALPRVDPGITGGGLGRGGGGSSGRPPFIPPRIDVPYPTRPPDKPRIPPDPVPEPATLALVALGSAVLIRRTRSRAAR